MHVSPWHYRLLMLSGTSEKWGQLRDDHTSRMRSSRPAVTGNLIVIRVILVCNCTQGPDSSCLTTVPNPSWTRKRWDWLTTLRHLDPITFKEHIMRSRGHPLHPHSSGSWVSTVAKPWLVQTILWGTLDIFSRNYGNATLRTCESWLMGAPEWDTGCACETSWNINNMIGIFLPTFCGLSSLTFSPSFPFPKMACINLSRQNWITLA